MLEHFGPSVKPFRSRPMANLIPHFINGRLVPGAGRTAPVFNPATGAQSGDVSLATTAEVRAAVQAASAMADDWAATTPLKRARILNAFLRILDERTDELAAVITAEHGKVLADAKGEIQRGIGNGRISPPPRRRS
jgi:malonate-semialdehyde dehydrogenase (acetylating)/methylmalonate-semialdehyde dehydrogenase